MIDDDDESTWPPPLEREIVPLRSDHASANGDFRYQHTSEVTRVLTDLSVSLFAVRAADRRMATDARVQAGRHLGYRA